MERGNVKAYIPAPVTIRIRVYEFKMWFDFFLTPRGVCVGTGRSLHGDFVEKKRSSWSDFQIVFMMFLMDKNCILTFHLFADD